MTKEIAPPLAPVLAEPIAQPVAPEVTKEKKVYGQNKVKTYQWTPEQVKEYFAEKYPNLKVPEGKKKPNAPGAWQTKKA